VNPFPRLAGTLWTELWRSADRNLQPICSQRLEFVSTDVDNPVPDVQSRTAHPASSPARKQLRGALAQ